jgi:putative transposase
MAKKKRHNLNEIEAKLREANALSAAGRTQSEIAKELNVSVMTLHRWRKAMPRSAKPAPLTGALGDGAAEGGRSGRFAELQLENARLRKLVTDLLLEKVKLEEGRVQGFENPRATLKKA